MEESEEKGAVLVGVEALHSIALTYPARSHFQRTLNRERQSKGLDERCPSSREGEE